MPIRPPAGEWTTDDLDALPEDGRRRELLDGALILPPSPRPAHQSITARLAVALAAGSPAHLDVTQRVQLRISRRRAFVPDVLAYRFEAATRDTSHFEPADVVLVVEVVCDGSTALDRILKPALYAEAGIGCYWRVETEPAIVVHTHRLDEHTGTYRQTGTFERRLDVCEPWPVDLDLDRLRARRA